MIGDKIGNSYVFPYIYICMYIESCVISDETFIRLAIPNGPTSKAL